MWGWLENEEETELKFIFNERISGYEVQQVKIPHSIDIADGNLIYTQPIWCAKPLMFRYVSEKEGDREGVGAGMRDDVVTLGELLPDP